MNGHAAGTSKCEAKPFAAQARLANTAAAKDQLQERLQALEVATGVAGGGGSKPPAVGTPGAGPALAAAENEALKATNSQLAGRVKELEAQARAGAKAVISVG